MGTKATCILFDRALPSGRTQTDDARKYAPSSTACPAPLPSVRPATSLSSQETDWLARRENATGQALLSVLERAQITNMDVQGYLQGILDKGGMMPRIGIAVSGGGYRALMNGAGALAAFDNRTTGSTGPGGLGGILQASTYVSGLSGGSWLVGSLYIANFTTVESIVGATDGFLSQLWQFNETIIEGPSYLARGLSKRVDANLQQVLPPCLSATTISSLTMRWMPKPTLDTIRR